MEGRLAIYVMQPDGSLQNTPPEYMEVQADVVSCLDERDQDTVGGKADDYCKITRYDFL